uniref:C2 domain-containing protein n=1 Tax=Odontella aurita TaxID=265563 RepID=A0A7S4IXV7_9STRA|mmetsp:Transcript_32253/g.96725  ORF Transcript_32253/g.96725 Transcript_32253/m.96725 type:complete len:602 (+) Transcript_32253:188-1993(+)|eukprot:CAMPEP_0113526726 /NCGR_PEP_ID=MMETSP0015_2-20120614/905_1 /TAXON_ID=2838 /ORGANISM="Odontella" /LENGTH=601 /DNA_ID=CAMNT_0000425091 /DNA_START=84 /DNA_END=1886 /DNA_ORIENTATION=- /assembly_acc=CAM_ASM_000160
MKLQLSIYARKLSNVAGAFKGTSDPFAVVTKIVEEGGGQPEVLGKTEVIKNTLNPDWTKTFVFDCELGTPVKFAVQVFDEVRKGDNKSMGSAVFDVGSLLGAKGNTKAKKLKKSGTIFARVEKYRGEGTLRLGMKGVKLKNMEGFMKKSDPFYELNRKVDGPSGTMWDAVFRSKHVSNNLSPVWGDSTIDLGVLCNGDQSQHILVRVFDHESDGKHVLMGEFETNVKGLVGARNGSAFAIMRKGKESGKIFVTKAEVMGVERLTEQVAAVSVSGAGTTPSAPGAFVPGAAPGVAAATAATGAFVPLAMPQPVSSGQPTFFDYTSGGCQINLSIAIDFTGSNGDPRQPGTLHYMHPDGSLNDYEKAIDAIGGILSKYDSDKKYAVYGFGAKYAGVVRHCFQVGPSSEVDGIDGVIQAYRGVFRTGLIMSGPTVFAEVIQTAAARAASAQEAANQNGEQAYSVLLILTDGAVTDVHSTAAQINQVSDAPLSIVIVGVGNADFSSMQFLDDSHPPGSRDIAQFVQFNTHSRNPQALTSATLNEIPDQLTGFFTSKGISPLPPQRMSEAEISVGVEEEIDLSLNFGSDGEIAVASGGYCAPSARW